jgi:hypothetical protein
MAYIVAATCTTPEEISTEDEPPPSSAFPQVIAELSESSATNADRVLAISVTLPPEKSALALFAPQPLLPHVTGSPDDLTAAKAYSLLYIVVTSIKSLLTAAQLPPFEVPQQRTVPSVFKAAKASLVEKIFTTPLKMPLLTELESPP